MKTDSSKGTTELLGLLRRLCAKLPGAEEYVMVHHPAFRVGKKPFAIETLVVESYKRVASKKQLAALAATPPARPARG